MATRKKKSYNISKAIDYLDNLEVSYSDESEDEDDEKLNQYKSFFSLLYIAMIWTVISIQELKM